MLKVHGLDLSYFTGKLEGYLRNKGLAYQLLEMDTRDFKRCAKATGVAQMPQVEWGNGQWLSDTHLIIPFLEAQHTDTSITCADEATHYVASLLEDFGDEWLWRPALYYRWANARDARLMSARLADGMMRDLPLPHAIRRQIILNRQKLHFLYLDGYSCTTAPRIEAHYLETLDALEKVLKVHPYVLGKRPTLADYGFFGSMFRHFFSDPTPAQIMRTRAPAVHEWVARLWNTRLTELVTQPLPSSWPAELDTLFGIIEREFIPYMQANEAAWVAGKRKFGFTSEGVKFTVPVHAYRAWRFQRLRQRFAALSAQAKAKVNTLPSEMINALSQPIKKQVPAAIEHLPVTAAKKRKFSARTW